MSQAVVEVKEEKEARDGGSCPHERHPSASFLGDSISPWISSFRFFISQNEKRKH